MLTDRESLALYETPEALALLDGKWPEWVDARNPRRRRLQFDGQGWWIEYHNGDDWMPICHADDHTALCILRDDARVKLEKRWWFVQPEEDCSAFGVRDMAGDCWLCKDGMWTADVTEAGWWPTYDAALLAGLAAATDEGKK